MLCSDLAIQDGTYENEHVDPFCNFRFQIGGISDVYIYCIRSLVLMLRCKMGTVFVCTTCWLSQLGLELTRTLLLTAPCPVEDDGC